MKFFHNSLVNCKSYTTLFRRDASFFLLTGTPTQASGVSDREMEKIGFGMALA